MGSSTHNNTASQPVTAEKMSIEVIDEHHTQSTQLSTPIVPEREAVQERHSGALTATMNGVELTQQHGQPPSNCRENEH